MIFAQKQSVKIYTVMLLMMVLVGFAMPVSKAFAQEDIQTVDIECFNGTNMSAMGCLANVTQGLAIATTWLASGFATVFDVSVATTLDNSNYNYDFIKDIWVILRDLANFGFIFVLLWIAFNLVLGTGDQRSKSMIITLIIAAIFINFSFFIGRVLVDVGNTATNVIYTRSAPVDTNAIFAIEGQEQIALSSELVSKFNPQKLLAGAASVGAVTPEDDTGAATRLFFFFLMGAVVVGFLAYSFLVVSLLMIARTVGIMLLLAVSPLAFVTLIIPKFRETKYIGWNDWWRKMANFVFLSVVFVFFLYVIYLLMDSVNSGVISNLEKLSTATNQADSAGWIASIFETIFPFLFVIILLKIAIKVSKNMAGEVGEMVSKGAAAVGKVVAGGALLATGVAGGAALRGTVGRAAARTASSTALQQRAAKGGLGGFMAKRQLAFAKSTASASFDARALARTKLGGKLVNRDVAEITGGAQRGGYTSQVSEISKKKEAFAKELELKGTGAEKAEKLRKLNKPWNKQYESDLSDAQIISRSKGTELDKKHFDEEYAKGGKFAMKGVNGQIVFDEFPGAKTAKPPTTEKEYNTQTREKYAESVEKGTDTLGGTVKHGAKQVAEGVAGAMVGVVTITSMERDAGKIAAENIRKIGKTKKSDVRQSEIIEKRLADHTKLLQKLVDDGHKGAGLAGSAGDVQSMSQQQQEKFVERRKMQLQKKQLTLLQDIRSAENQRDVLDVKFRANPNDAQLEKQFTKLVSEIRSKKDDRDDLLDEFKRAGDVMEKLGKTLKEKAQLGDSVKKANTPNPIPTPPPAAPNPIVN
ncbi:MAG: hypothetical protein OEX08_00345 [Candidatus Nomurabacteria bacterium]|nr:hypothetical protein [Candidatus Nomurabacteria bacterium]